MFLFRKRSMPETQDDDISLNNKSRRPPNTAFRQQRLKSWQPILSPRSVLPLLICIVCVFLPIGIGLIITAYGVQDLSIDYSKCDVLAPRSDEFEEIPSKYIRHHFKKRLHSKPSWRLVQNENDEEEIVCQLQFEIPNKINKSIYVYYKLSNFYQNHRSYVESFDHNQLKGKVVKLDKLNTACRPLRTYHRGEEDEKIVYPCGLIANSMFNDTFSNKFVNIDSDDDGVEDYLLTNKKISWSIDRHHRFKRTHYNVSDIVPPPNWMKKFPDGYSEDNLPNLEEWEELQVWMRTAAFPKFYKLALKNETSALKAGNYTIDIGLNYPVSIFGGSKSFIISTSVGIGGRNVSLGVVFLIVTCVGGLFAMIFLVTLCLQPRTMGDHSYLNFDEEEDNSNENRIKDATTSLREIL
ncbi:aminophospholipid translocase regulatory protein CDC50 NDAI_0I00280 [Naumovozyma dairenensis CBS 421]|uniref:Cell division control protein 50 n=1 Tax=Naumovozyma dairenensis (strain ATCC 10597 / BCRC 20456 / CBS 421 / NBRC 0211 / NRRL Y-12639) TaxID=1071378 RepID=G0WFN6_NAUDC|nr:hypothetical protein NDAI_0I00280 [Naumovozyma dairenensis CBS 421]CCD26597.1 hypothetical protein NDAI_0I00280 [Naumovozyma dairenensis CBS 421]